MKPNRLTNKEVDPVKVINGQDVPEANKVVAAYRRQESPIALADALN